MQQSHRTPVPTKSGIYLMVWPSEVVRDGNITVILPPRETLVQVTASEQGVSSIEFSLEPEDAFIEDFPLFSEMGWRGPLKGLPAITSTTST